MQKILFFIKISRLDHFIKHLFIIPGILFAALLIPNYEVNQLNILLGFLSSFLIASSNYAINEFLDREHDQFHPKKKSRVLVKKDIRLGEIFVYCTILYFAGFAIASLINLYFLLFSVIFSLSGIIYNLKPLRLKDIVYVDVLIESLNNPIRFF